MAYCPKVLTEVAEVTVSHGLRFTGGGDHPYSLVIDCKGKTAADVYSEVKRIWCQPEHMQDAMPMVAHSPDDFTMENSVEIVPTSTGWENPLDDLVKATNKIYQHHQKDGAWLHLPDPRKP
jgi:hypothetical protein